jgi:hypothetical protein
MRGEAVTSSGPPLCRFAGHTCAACCWGEQVAYPTLRTRLRRQAALFACRFRGASRPGRWDLLLYELSVRGAADLICAALLLVPILGDWLRPRLKKRLTCAFLGFEDSGHKHVGCLLHPTRWAGRDVRSQAAFALLPGFACGSPDYFCLAAHFFNVASWRDRVRFECRTRGLGWYAYSGAASTYRPGRPA